MEQLPVMVSIRCLAYNHEPYIRECLDGFVMQQTNFRFEAIVHDDASTDGTADIIREYAEKYPDIIKPIFETENQYSKHDGSLGRIMRVACTGKYIAMCEGDDYWTDPLKLQKQVDFLEEHEDYSMCFHAAEIKNEAMREIDINCENINEREYFLNDVFPQWIVPTASIMYRSESVTNYKMKHREWLIAGDIVLILKCLHRGRVWGMSKQMSVYRIVNNGAMVRIGSDCFADERYINHIKCLMLNFPLIDKKECLDHIIYSDIQKFIRNDGMFGRWHYFFDVLYVAPNKFCFFIKSVIKHYWKQ